jgi:hypothetical protein
LWDDIPAADEVSALDLFNFELCLAVADLDRMNQIVRDPSAERGVTDAEHAERLCPRISRFPMEQLFLW